ncbi:MAG TPA: TlpA disulfide reductase family protein [Myxococcaceae bacterium]|nr:TlpA disulfide reductase family protein [Myxococcaceae bacterium]
MRPLLLLCVLVSTLAQAQQSSTSSSGADSQGKRPSVVELASQKVTIPTARIPLRTLQGKDVRLGDHGAKVVVVSLWSTIHPDHSFLGVLEQLHQGYKGRKDVAILAINVDLPQNEEDLEVLRGIIREQGVTYPALQDKELKLMALVNEKLNSGAGERNSFLTPPFLIFTRKFEQMEWPEWQESLTGADLVKELRQKVEQARKRK